MPLPPETIEVGKCYLSDEGRVRRVVRFLPDGRIQYAYRTFPTAPSIPWRTGRLPVERFAKTVVREVPCNWRPETDEQP